MSSIFGNRDFWLANGKSLLIQLAATVITYAGSTLIPGMEKEGMLALAGLSAILVNAIQKAFRLPTK